MYEWNSEHFHFQTVFISICSFVRARCGNLCLSAILLDWIGLGVIALRTKKNWKKIWKEREICLESRHFQIVRCEFLLFNFRCDRREGKEEEIETCIRILTDWKFVFSSSFHLEEEKKFLFHSLLCIIIVLLCMWMVFFFKLLFEC